MANPVGSVVASPTTVNEFYGELADHLVSTFHEKRNEVRPFIRNSFMSLDDDGSKPYIVEHGRFAQPLPGPMQRGEGVEDAGAGSGRWSTTRTPTARSASRFTSRTSRTVGRRRS